MRKVLLFFLIAILFCGCSEYSKDSFTNKMDEFLDNLKDREIYQNNHGNYMSYFMPSDMREIEYDDLYVVFGYLDSKIVMNINTSAIVNYEIYDNDILFDDGFLNDKNIVYSKNGYCSDLNDYIIRYSFNIYEYESSMILHLVTNNVNIYGYSSKEEAIMTAQHMMTLARGASINEDKLLEKYSSQTIKSKEVQTIDLFSYIVPEEGNIDDLLK